MRVGSAEELVDEEESGGVLAGEEDGVKALDFCEEFGLALGEGVGAGREDVPITRGVRRREVARTGAPA